MNLETLFSNLLDKLRRIKSINSAYFVRPNKRQRTSKTSTKKYCEKCKTSSHQTKDYFHLFPNKAPDWFKEKVLNQDPERTKFRKKIKDNVYSIREPPIDLEEEENQKIRNRLLRAEAIENVRLLKEIDL